MKTKQLLMEMPIGVWGRVRRLALRCNDLDEDIAVRALALGLAQLEANHVLDQLEAQRDG